MFTKKNVFIYYCSCTENNDSITLVSNARIVRILYNAIRSIPNKHYYTQGSSNQAREWRTWKIEKINCMCLHNGKLKIPLEPELF